MTVGESRIAADQICALDHRYNGTQGTAVIKVFSLTAATTGAKVTDLAELELSYAPPFSSAKDPVNMLGFIAQNILEGNTNLVDYHYMQNRDVDNTILLNVRTSDEFARGHVDGAVNIPVGELRGRLDEIDKLKEIIEYCQVGVRGHIAERILTNHGFNEKNISGGFKTINSLPKE